MTPYVAVPVFRVGWKESPSPSIDPGPFGSEIFEGETADLSVACRDSKRAAAINAAINGLLQITRRIEIEVF